jgi:hypothetical protein
MIELGFLNWEAFSGVKGVVLIFSIFDTARACNSILVYHKPVEFRLCSVRLMYMS